MKNRVRWQRGLCVCLLLAVVITMIPTALWAASDPDGNTAASTEPLLTREEAAFIASSDPIVVGLLPHREPLSYMDEHGDAAGLTVDLMDLVAKKSGLTLEYRFLETGQTGLSFLSDDGGDLVAGAMESAFSTLNPALLQSQTLYEGSVVFVGKAGMEFNTGSNLRVALPAGFINGEAVINQAYPNFTCYHGDSMADCLSAIRDGRADVMIQNMYISRDWLQSPQYENLQIFPAYSFPEHMKVVTLPDNEALLSIVNKSINSFTEDEVNDIVIANTIGKVYQATWSDLLYKYRLPLIGIAVLLMAVLVLCATIMILRQRNYRRMTAANKKLEESNAMLEEINDALGQSNEKINEANQQLRDAVLLAERANLAKSQFLSRMSHEIRTPMNAIVGLTTIARRHTEDPKKMEEYLMKIDASSKVLLNIINDVLDMSAIESNKLKIGHNPFDMKEMLSALVGIYYTQCKQKGVRFEMDAAELKHEALVGDGLRMNQILLNLISNAYKFTPAGGSVRVSVKETAVHGDKVYLRFIVADTGIGMSDDLKHRLFQPFEQEDAKTAQQYGGSGLGLSIAKNLIDMMQGAITVESEEGKGTTFTVDLPFEIGEMTWMHGDEKFRSIRALIVDDDQQTQEYTSIVLGRIGVDFDVAQNGEMAIDMLRQAYACGSGYDICFLDWKMPGLSGIDVTRKIRELFDQDTVIIIVSAYDLSEVEDEAKMAGANMFVSKPLFQSTVFNVLMTLSGGKYTHQTAKQGDYDFTGKRVLLAEDNAMNSEIAIDLLELVQLDCDLAEDGQKAVDLFEASEPGTYDIILMDIQMPILDGYEATKAIRASAHPEAKTIPIFAMTANAFTEDVSAALSAGMNGHIAKPIDTEILYSTIEKALKGSIKHG